MGYNMKKSSAEEKYQNERLFNPFTVEVDAHF